jgi:hypothetical protein
MRKTFSVLACFCAAASLALAPLLAMADSITVPKETDVTLIFDESLSSKTAKEGQTVKMHVADDVTVDGKTVLKAGTPVTGTITKVSKRKRFGVNARMRFAINPVKSAMGTMIPLEPREKGKAAGSKTGEAAGASAGGAILLGPVGLVGGYFVVGKSVTIRPGDKLVSMVSQDTTINWK